MFQSCLHVPSFINSNFVLLIQVTLYLMCFSKFNFNFWHVYNACQNTVVTVILLIKYTVKITSYVCVKFKENTFLKCVFNLCWVLCWWITFITMATRFIQKFVKYMNIFVVTFFIYDTHISHLLTSHHTTTSIIVYTIYIYSSFFFNFAVPNKKEKLLENKRNCWNYM